MLTAEMKDLVASEPCFVATVDRQGWPSIGPKRSMRVWDDQTLIFNEYTGRHTLQNIQEGSIVAIAVSKIDGTAGYRFTGRAECFTSGMPFKDAVEYSKRFGLDLPKTAVLVHIDRIYNLREGKQAGQRVDE